MPAERIVGLPLDIARKILEGEGMTIEEVALSRPPQGSSRKSATSETDATYVASAWNTAARSVKLRTVSVPSIKPAIEHTSV